MRFDVYGRYQLEVLRENDAWVVYRQGSGSRSPAADLVVPENLGASEIATYLDDLLHELDADGRGIRQL